MVSVPPGGVPTALDEALTALRRRHGAAVVHRGDAALAAGAQATGIPALDRLLPGGGLPRGRLCVLAGEGRGATGRLSLLQVLAAAASREGEVAYLDLAGSLDPGFLADLGADLGACLVLRPRRRAAGPGLAMARALVRAGVPWLAVALGRRGPERGEAAAVEHALTALAGAVEAARAVACVAATAPLPAALAHASSLTVACAPLGWQEAHGDVVGLRVRLRVVKSRLGAPGGEAGLLLRYPRPQAMGEAVGLPALLGGDAGTAGGAGTASPGAIPPVASRAAADAAAAGWR